MHPRNDPVGFIIYSIDYTIIYNNDSEFHCAKRKQKSSKFTAADLCKSAQSPNMGVLLTW